MELTSRGVNGWKHSRRHERTALVAGIEGGQEMVEQLGSIPGLASLTLIQCTTSYVQGVQYAESISRSTRKDILRSSAAVW